MIQFLQEAAHVVRRSASWTGMSWEAMRLFILG